MGTHLKPVRKARYIVRYNFGMMELLTSYWAQSLIISPVEANNKEKGQTLFN